MPRLLNIAIAIATTALALAVIEAVCRAADCDFGGVVRSFDRTPIYYRRPAVPVGEVFFRRAGPARWTGRVIRSGMGDGPYAWLYDDEPTLTITYDRQGFRNPDELDEWQVAVAGDSMVELGFLPYEDLFTTQLGQLLGVRVKNLGVSSTGTLTHIEYLDRYGRSSSTTDVVLVFFEGNDVRDFENEAEALRRFRETGSREYREARPRPQSSFLRALHDAVGGDSGATEVRANAFYVCESRRTPVTVSYAVPDPARLEEGVAEEMEAVLARWARRFRDTGIQPWLVYLPAKRRVLDGYLEFAHDTRRELADWRPTELPAVIHRVCLRHGIAFVDAHPRLAYEVGKCRLPYNSVWDTHLNRRGSDVVARTLAEALEAARTLDADVGRRAVQGRGAGPLHVDDRIAID